MNVYDATEQAYKNGYEHGYNDGKNAMRVHGRWEKNHPSDNIVYCNRCAMPQDCPSDYCHSCGAIMDLDRVVKLT